MFSEIPKFGGGVGIEKLIKVVVFILLFFILS
jgi:hypothetical protein